MKNTAKKSLSVVLALIMLMSCIGISVSAEANGYAPLRITCTMYGDSQTQRGFCWFTEDDCDTVVEIVKATSGKNFDEAMVFEGESKEFQGYYSHKVVATGLEAGTTYYYRVGSEEESIWSAEGKFVTDDGNGKFSFLAIADVQASSEENFEKAAAVMDAARATDKNAEFYVNLGDFVNDCTNEEWNWYGDKFLKTNTALTLVPVAGNHEGNPTNKLNPGWFANTFTLDKAEGSLDVNGVYYSFDYGNAHFCVLNSNDMYPMTEMQRNWIINDLNHSEAHWKFLLLHRAAYSAGKNIDKPDTLAMRNTIIEIVDATDVDMVFSGHDHMYMRTKQVKADAVVEDVEYVTEVFNGVETTFAKEPDGAVYVLPSTAGTKRYSVNEYPLDPINDCAEVSLSTKDLGGCFADVCIDGNKLVYRAYAVNDETKEVSEIDSYAIIKENAENHTDERNLNTSIIKTLDGSILNTIVEICRLIVTYVTKLLPQVIVDAVGGLF